MTGLFYMLKVLLFISIQIVSNLALAQDVLFVLYDAGETKGMQNLIEHYNQTGVDVKVLTFGTAAEVYQGANKVELNKILGEEVVVKKLWRRDQTIEPKHIEILKNKFQPKVLITGTVSALQKQVATELDVATLRAGFFDAFSRVSEKHPIKDFTSVLDEVWIPSKLQEDEFKKLSFKKVKVTGHGSLNDWQVRLSTKEKAQITSVLRLDQKKPTITYIGGYGESYEKGLRYFLKSIDSSQDYNIVISLHPKVDGTVEAKILEEMGKREVIIAPKYIPTQKITALSEFVITQNSTVGVQVLVQEKNVIYFHLNTRYKNIAIENGAAFQTANPKALNEYLKNPPKVEIKNLGIPQNSLESFLRGLPEGLNQANFCSQAFQLKKV